VLVRPDGMVAWRKDALPDDPTAALGAAMGQLLGLAAEVAAS
jgi:hypothetical protein